MQQLSSLEESLAKALKDVPHLPKGLRDWLVENAWWLVIVGVAFGVIALFSLIPSLFVAASFVSAYVGAGYGTAIIISGVIAIVVLIATIVIEAMAIQPLKEKRKRGWDLLFLSSLIGIGGSLVQAVVGGNIVGGILMVAVTAVIAFYLLFELRPHYLAKPATVKK